MKAFCWAGCWKQHCVRVGEKTTCVRWRWQLDLFLVLKLVSLSFCLFFSKKKAVLPSSTSSWVPVGRIWRTCLEASFGFVRAIQQFLSQVSGSQHVFGPPEWDRSGKAWELLLGSEQPKEVTWEPYGLLGVSGCGCSDFQMCFHERRCWNSHKVQFVMPNVLLQHTPLGSDLPRHWGTWRHSWAPAGLPESLAGSSAPTVAQGIWSSLRTQVIRRLNFEPY